jgi:GNAT superfamily N-acetyltransferase
MGLKVKLVIGRVQPRDLPDIAALAAFVWKAHYPGIIPPAQIDYMLARMYDVEVMRRELAEGMSWFKALIDGAVVGFAAAGATEAAGEFKLHKLYVHHKWQRHGIGGVLLRIVEKTARERGATTLILNVNKRNTTAIAAYHKRGFTIRESVVIDIGGGFVMDDHVMEKGLFPPAGQ